MSKPTPLEKLLDAVKEWATADERANAVAAVAAKRAEGITNELADLSNDEYLDAVKDIPPALKELYSAAFDLREKVDRAAKAWFRSLPADGKVVS
jgi:hypothetical protein